MIDLALIAACAPNVHPHTIQELIRVESVGNPIAVNVNKHKKTGAVYKRPKIKTAQEAIAVTYAAIAEGHTVDMGYMQINSPNLKWLGYTVEEMFVDPCKNLAAGAKIFTMAYESELPKHNGDEQAALRAALSIYNTGNAKKGFKNGYVARYVGSLKEKAASVDPYTADTAIKGFKD